MRYLLLQFSPFKLCPLLYVKLSFLGPRDVSIAEDARRFEDGLDGAKSYILLESVDTHGITHGMVALGVGGEE